jgi:hypothetical protein
VFCKLCSCPIVKNVRTGHVQVEFAFSCSGTGAADVTQRCHAVQQVFGRSVCLATQIHNIYQSSSSQSNWQITNTRQDARAGRNTSSRRAMVLFRRWIPLRQTNSIMLFSILDRYLFIYYRSGRLRVPVDYVYKYLPVCSSLIYTFQRYPKL